MMTRCSSPLNHRRLLVVVLGNPMKTMGEHRIHRCHRNCRMYTGEYMRSFYFGYGRPVGQSYSNVVLYI